MTDIFRIEPQPTQARPFVPTKAAAVAVASWLAAAQQNRSALAMALAAIPEATQPVQPSSFLQNQVTNRNSVPWKLPQPYGAWAVPDPEPKQPPPLVTLRTEFESAGSLAAATNARRWLPQVAPDAEPTQGGRPVFGKTGASTFESAGYMTAALLQQRVSQPPQRLPDPEPTQIPPLITLRREESEPWLAAVTTLRSGVRQPPPDPEPWQKPPLVTLRTEFESAGFLAATRSLRAVAVPPQVLPDPEPTQVPRLVTLRTEFDSAGWLSALLKNRAAVLQPPDPDRPIPAPTLVLSRTQTAFDSSWLFSRSRASTSSPLDPDALTPRLLFVSGVVAATPRSMDGVLAALRWLRPLAEDGPPLQARVQVYGRFTAASALAGLRPAAVLTPDPEPLPQGWRIYVSTGRASPLVYPFPRPLGVTPEDVIQLQRAPSVGTAAKGSDWLAVRRSIALPEVDPLPQGSPRVVSTFRAESAGFLAASRRILLPQDEPPLLVRPATFVGSARHDALVWLIPSLQLRVPQSPEEFTQLQRMLLRWFPDGFNADRIFYLVGFSFGLRRFQGAAQATARFSGTARMHREE